MSYCNECGGKAENEFGINKKLMLQDKVELIRCVSCGYKCGGCSKFASIDWRRNRRIIEEGYDLKLLRCNKDCSIELVEVCNRCKIKVRTSINEKVWKNPPKSNVECNDCERLSYWENKLSGLSKSFGPPYGRGVRRKEPIVCELMKDVQLTTNGLTERKIIWFDIPPPINSNSIIKSTVTINQLDEDNVYLKFNKMKWKPLSERKGHFPHELKRDYWRIWQSVLADFESFLRIKYSIQGIEIETWKERVSDYLGEYEYMRFNYPIIIHYHLIVK